MNRKNSPEHKKNKRIKIALSKSQTAKRPALFWLDNWIQNPFLVLLVLELTGFLVYFNILHAPFVFDDISFRDTPTIHADSLSKLFGVLVDDSMDRRIGYFTFAANFYLGGLNTFGYHLVNVLIHILNGWLIFWLVANTLKLPRLKGLFSGKQAAEPVGKSQDVNHSANRIAFFTALIWLVHPVQIMAVTYIVQRLASLAALLFLASFAAYLKGRLSTGWKQYVFFVMSALAGLLSLGVKQHVAVLPFFIALYDLYFFHESPWKALKKKASWLLALGIFLVTITLVYLGPSFWATLQERFALREFTMAERLLSEARVVLYYLSLIVLPLPSRLNVDYDFPVSTSLIDPFSTLLAVVIILAGIVYALKAAGERPLLSFAILWYLGNLAIESSIIPLDLVFEHRLYLPSIAPIVVITVLISQKLFARHAKAAVLMLMMIASVYGLWTYQRNLVWKDPVTLWQDNAKKSPQKGRVHGNLGKALLDVKRYHEAEIAFQNAVKYDPNLLGAYVNLANICIDYRKDYDRARAYLHTALEKYPDYPTAYLNLGVMALNLGEKDPAQLPAAIEAFEKVLELDPQNLSAHYNLAACFINLQKLPEALQILDRGLSYWPAGHRLYLLKGRIHFMRRETEAARSALTAAHALRPDDPEVKKWYGKVVR